MRGVGQCVMKFKDLAYFYERIYDQDDLSNIDVDKFTLGGSVDDLKDGKNWFKGQDFHIQRFINIKAEYRVLFNQNGAVDVVERTINSQSGFQANGQINKVVPIQTVAGNIDIEAIVKHIGLPFGSMDIYGDEDNNMGVLEYSPEFAFTSHSPSLVHKMVNDSIKNIISNYQSTTEPCPMVII